MMVTIYIYIHICIYTYTYTLKHGVPSRILTNQQHKFHCKNSPCLLKASHQHSPISCISTGSARSCSATLRSPRCFYPSVRWLSQQHPKRSARQADGPDAKDQISSAVFSFVITFYKEDENAESLQFCSSQEKKRKTTSLAVIGAFRWQHIQYSLSPISCSPKQVPFQLHID